MAIMRSCCCWQSVRKGSFACAIYTGIYFTLIFLTTATLLKSERQYLTGNRSVPESVSLLESNTISVATVRFNVILFLCSCCGIISCLLLLYGLFKNERNFLLPWISTTIACSVTDISHSVYLFCFVSLGFNPITALVYTLDFFLLCLNIYAVLCVVSQYQEYIAGRGTVRDCERQIPAIRYAIQSTPTNTAMTSCLSSRRSGVENNPTKTTSCNTGATTTPSGSPTKCRSVLSPEGINSIDHQTLSSLPNTARKHVQFPDSLHDH